VLQGNLFWSTLGFAIVCSGHWLALRAAASVGLEAPGLLQLPHLEIKVLMVLVMGFLDSSLGVLADPSANGVWKAVAVLAIAPCLALAAWFMNESHTWKVGHGCI
jgi:hypothetical protein